MNPLWILGIGAAIAGLVQGISGFAFSMVAVSIWVWGLDPKFAATMAVFGGGKEQGRTAGARPAADIEAFIQSTLARR